MDTGLLLLSLSVGFSLIYYMFISAVHKSTVPDQLDEEDIPVSVIIAARNEAANLERNLPAILSQAYKRFEIIVINDNSTDATLDVLEKLASAHENLRVHTVKEGQGKKNALNAGIELAQHEWLLFTDADCSPLSDLWIRTMFSNLSRNTNLILGYSSFNKTQGLANSMARVDAFSIGVQYLSFALYGIPYMGVGRNMAYKKTLFRKVGGFEKHMKVLSGDDDLFIQAVSRDSETVVRLGVNSQTKSESKTSVASLFVQKRRQASAGFHYKIVTLLILGVIQLLMLGFYGAIVYNILYGSYIWSGLLLILIRFYSQYSVLKKAAGKLGENDLLLLSLILEFPLIIFNLLAGISNILFKTRRWS